MSKTPAKKPGGERGPLWAWPVGCALVWLGLSVVTVPELLLFGRYSWSMLWTDVVVAGVLLLVAGVLAVAERVVTKAKRK